MPTCNVMGRIGRYGVIILSTILLLTVPMMPTAQLTPARQVVAQGDDDACPAIVETALESVGDLCDDLGRNEVCYGHTLVTATNWEDVQPPGFEVSGDLVDVTGLASLATFPMDTDEGTWGVAVLSLQADLSDTLPGQAVTFIIFGDAELRSEVPPETQAAPPTEPEPYDYDEVRNAPVQLLPEAVSIPLAVTGVSGTSPYIDWIDSGVEVSAGQTFTIAATGEVDFWPLCANECSGYGFDNCESICANVVNGPAGGGSLLAEITTPEAFANFPLPDQILWALVGRIGDTGAPFLIGEGGTFTADADGTLQFVHNDGWSHDRDQNIGVFTVVIEFEEGE